MIDQKELDARWLAFGRRLASLRPGPGFGSRKMRSRLYNKWTEAFVTLMGNKRYKPIARIAAITLVFVTYLLFYLKCYSLWAKFLGIGRKLRKQMLGEQTEHANMHWCQ